MAHGVKRQMELKDFFQSLEQDDQAESLKISEYPESCPLHMVLPEMTKEFFKLMPFKRHILPTGPMNMVSFMVFFFNQHLKINLLDEKYEFRDVLSFRKFLLFPYLLQNNGTAFLHTFSQFIVPTSIRLNEYYIGNDDDMFALYCICQLSSLPWQECPFVGPKVFAGHNATDAMDPTPIHTDLADAANVCVHQSGSDSACLWHIFHRESYDKVAR